MAIAAYWPDYEKLSEEAKMANPVWDEKLYELKLTGSVQNYKLLFIKG